MIQPSVAALSTSHDNAAALQTQAQPLPSAALQTQAQPLPSAALQTQAQPPPSAALPTVHFPPLLLYFSTLYLATFTRRTSGHSAQYNLFPLVTIHVASLITFSLSLSLSLSLFSPRKLNMELGTAVSTVHLPVKVKVKFTLEEATKAQRGSRRIGLLFL
jgi:hypothetical protein